MFTKSIISLAVLAVAQIVSAQSSAQSQSSCFMYAINKFEHPADQQTICCKQQAKMMSYIGSVCPDWQKQAAVSQYTLSCQQAGYGSCANSTSSATSGSSASSTGAPYPITYTTTYYDTKCGCTKTKAVSTMTPASTGFYTGASATATGTSSGSTSGSGSGSGSGAGGAAGSGPGGAVTGSPISPAAPSKTGAPSSTFTGAASKNVGSVAAGLMAVAAVALAL